MREANGGTTRFIAVEEHIATEWYLNETGDMRIGPGEEAERSFMSGFDTDPKLRVRMVDLDFRLNTKSCVGSISVSTRRRITGCADALD